MKVTLSKRGKGNRVSLYLDYYNKGHRQYEYLNLYLSSLENGTLTREQKDEDRKPLALAEAIRSKRNVEVQNSIYSFRDREKVKASFIKYFEDLVERKNSSKGNYDNWDSALMHLRRFVRSDISFGQLLKK